MIEEQVFIQPRCHSFYENFQGATISRTETKWKLMALQLVRLSWKKKPDSVLEMPYGIHFLGEEG
jgi:transposase-like protein